MAEANEQVEALIGSLSESETLGFDAMRQCLWVIDPPADDKWDGTDIESVWKNCVKSRENATMLMDSLKRAGLTVSKTDEPYESPFKATQEDLKNWETAYQADTSNH